MAPETWADITVFSDSTATYSTCLSPIINLRVSSNTNCSYRIIYTQRQQKEDLKRAIKKLSNIMCKDGWLEHQDYYLIPEIKPVHLRGVRLEGRGWAN